MSHSVTRRDDRAGGTRRERGVALLMVLLMLALLGSVVADFQYNSRVDLQLAINARDELQAEYNALTALKVRAILLKNSQKLKGMLNGIMGALGGVTGGAAGGAGAGQAGGGAAAAFPITQMLEMIPVECGLLGAIARKAEDPFGFDEEELAAAEEAEPFFAGDCLATSKSEHSKVPIGLLRYGNRKVNEDVTRILLGFLSDRKLERHFQEDDRNGTHAEDAEELVGALTDWIDDDDDQAVNTVADEDRPYAFLRDNYRVKNAPFDSLAELQLVHGIDDELYELLRDHVTIYNNPTSPKIELPTASEMTILMGLIAARHEGMNIDMVGNTLGMFWASMAEMRQLGGLAFAPLTTATLTQLASDTGLSAFIDTQKIGQVFSDAASTTWFTIDAQGRAGNASRKIRAVFQAQEAKFYYVRIE